MEGEAKTPASPYFNYTVNVNPSILSNMVQFLGSIFGISFSILLFFSQKNHRANRYLSLLLLITGLSILLQLGLDYEIQLRFPHIIHLFYPANLLYGPLLFLFTREMTFPHKTPRRTFLHFIPFLFLMMFLIPSFYILTGSEKIRLFHQQGEGFIQNFFQWFQYLILFHGFSYTLASFMETRAYQKAVHRCFSQSEKVSLEWLQRIILIILFIWSITISWRLFDYQLPLTGNDMGKITGFLGIFLIYLVAFLMMRQPDLFQYLTLLEEESQPLVPLEKSPGKYRNLTMDETTCQKHCQSLYELLSSKKLYLNPEFTVKDLAQEMGISSAQLSMVISSQTSENFHSLINRFRVEEATKLLISSEFQNRNILDVALSSGFHSKSVFNRYFKQITGTTPLQYKKSHQK
ncbi:MAG: helix-turn-helix domain-containing protein [Spirochaetales bacterium]|nr:helix-turn-helix domain-containing protein [Spirochaetales bacterium]